MMKRMLMRKPVSKMAGLTLLETMFGVAIGALILIAAVVFYTSTKQSQNVSKVVTDLNSIVAQSSNYIAPGGTALTNLTGATNTVATLQGAGYLPTPMNDPWGVEYTATATAGTTSGIVATTSITIPGIGGTSDTSCKAIIQATTGPTTSSDSTGSACIITFNL